MNLAIPRALAVTLAYFVVMPSSLRAQARSLFDSLAAAEDCVTSPVPVREAPGWMDALMVCGTVSAAIKAGNRMAPDKREHVFRRLREAVHVKIVEWSFTDGAGGAVPPYWTIEFAFPDEVAVVYLRQGGSMELRAVPHARP